MGLASTSTFYGLKLLCRIYNFNQIYPTPRFRALLVIHESLTFPRVGLVERKAHSREDATSLCSPPVKS